MWHVGRKIAHVGNGTEFSVTRAYHECRGMQVLKLGAESMWPRVMDARERGCPAGDGRSFLGYKLHHNDSGVPEVNSEEARLLQTGEEKAEI